MITARRLLQMAVRLSLSYARELAANYGGRCLSTKYRNNTTALDWICASGHSWSATIRSVQAGTWCPDCSGRKRWTLEEMQSLAATRNGRCLSKTFKNIHSNILWECASGHRWQATPHNVLGYGKNKRGTWCLICSGNAKGSLGELQQYARSRGGKCLSKQYVNRKTPLEFECNEAHRWFAKPEALLNQRQWCLKCSGHERKTEQQMQILAESRGGRFLSDHYAGANRKHRWQCADGHEWDATPGSVAYGSWCPDCQINYGEEVCRLFFEAIFRAPFPRCRPTFLKAANGRFLQLDGYNSALGIAFEHQGRQHFEFLPAFHKTTAKFDRNREFDRRKADMCAAEGVKLVIIPEVPELTPMEQLSAVLTTEFKRLRIKPPASPHSVSIDPSRAYNLSQLQKIKLLAEIRGGQCISPAYLGGRVKLSFICAAGHAFEKQAEQVKSGQWCARCYGNVPLTLEDMQDLAAKRGGKCISGVYKGVGHRLEWECAVGHRWFAAPSDVKGTKSKRGSWCPDCSSNRRGSIAKMQLLAKQRGGRCLSILYERNDKKLEWECAQHHRWFAIPNAISNGQWCPQCAIARRVAALTEYRARQRAGQPQ